MNKLIIGLLLIAATAGTFYVLQKKRSNVTNDYVKKELILGKWKIKSYDAVEDSSHSLLVGIMALVDSNTFKYTYEFTKDKKVLRLLGDSVSIDTSEFDWQNDLLLWKEDRQDTTGELLLVKKLDKDSLRLMSDDSTQIIFTREK
ncbi:MAG TPA: hypothetical protein VFZ42_01985 [Chitinophagaceae bacterium]